MNRLLTIVDSKYQRLEYLESTGTQYIDTGYVPNPNTEIDTKLKIVSWRNASYGAIFGCRTNNHASDAFLLCRYYTYDHCRFEIDGAYQTSILNLSEGIDCIVSIASTKFVCNDTDYNINMNRISPNDKHLFLFGLNEGGHIETAYGSASTRIYHFKISENGVVKKNFVPVLRKTDNELGMLDLVEGKFYTNAGTGKFTANLDTMYAIIQGSPTQSPYGVFSGFSASNYLALQQNFAPEGSWEVCFKVKMGSNVSLAKYFFGSTSYGIVLGNTDNPSGAFKVFLSSNGTSWDIGNLSTGIANLANSIRYVKIGFTGEKYYIEQSEDGITYIGRAELNSTKKIYSVPVRIGNSYESSNRYWQGAIDLNNSYIKLGSTKYNLQAVVGYTIVGSPTITDGVVSGFSFTSYNSGNYLQINNGQIDFSTDDFKIKLCASKINTVSTLQTLIATTNVYPIGIYVFINRVEFRLYPSNNTLIQKPIEYDIPSNTKFYIFLEKKGNNFIFGVSLDNINFTYNNFVQADIQTGNKTISIGHDYYRACPDCAIYLNETTIYKNNKLWFNGQQA